jgi:hypothetical protein
MAKRKVPLGRAIRWTEPQLDEFLVVTEADVDLARALWRKYARQKDLIDAQPVENDAITRRP